jgi:1-acyl-sn-glycerol-3-phosphate acyltransferase
MKLLNVLRAGIGIILYVVNLLCWFIPLLVLGLLFYLIPLKIWQNKCRFWMERFPVYWIKGNCFIQELTTSIEFEVSGLEQLVYDEWYLLIANHQSWADILVLQRIFNTKIPPLKFFMKRELLWTLPLASWACWLLGYPFMHRYSKETLAKKPELKNKDLEATRRACMRFKSHPTTVANFIEGTRFTERKRKLQNSPYRALLRPKAAGIGFSLAVLGDFFHKILNVTIIYPPQKASLWHFLSGDMQKVIVYIDQLAITPDWIGDYQNDRQYRVFLQNKLNQLWEQKDQLITKIKTSTTF